MKSPALLDLRFHDSPLFAIEKYAWTPIENSVNPRLTGKIKHFFFVSGSSWKLLWTVPNGRLQYIFRYHIHVYK